MIVAGEFHFEGALGVRFGFQAPEERAGRALRQQGPTGFGDQRQFAAPSWNVQPATA